MKIRDWLNKLLRRSPAKDGERSGDSVDEAFIDSSERAASSWIPSAQDEGRPRH